MNLQSILLEQLPISSRTRSKMNSSYISYQSPTLHQSYVSASDLQNFCLDDSFSDVIDLYHPAPNPHPLQSLFQKGIDFEDNIIQKLREHTGLPLPKLSSLKTSKDYNYWTSKQDFAITLEHMKRGEPILYSAYLWNQKEKLHGIPDLLVRNDYLSALFPHIEIDVQNKVSSFGNYYYVPVEIKYSTLNRIANKKFLSNTGRMKYYKTQLMMYNKILTYVQGIFPGYAFIIGKRVIDTDGTIWKELECQGYINYLTKDSQYVQFLEQAIDWMRNVKQYGRFWNWSDPQTIRLFNLFPNMKAIHPYHQTIKKEWASYLDEITQIWRCSTTHRENAHHLGIWSWKDERCTSQTLGITDGYSKIVDSILEVNRSDVGYLPKTLDENTIKEIEKTGNYDKIMYIDFETIQLDDDNQRIFMIGVWYNEQYLCFCMDENTPSEEIKIMLKFYEFYKNCNYPNAMYWYAELNFWNSACTRHNLKLNINWVDLYPLWTTIPIVFKGSFNFKLKSLISAMKTLGYTDLLLPPDECEDGMMAMKIAELYYTDKSTISKEQWESIKTYNQLDCQYVQELYKFMIKIRDDSMICIDHL